MRVHRPFYAHFLSLPCPTFPHQQTQTRQISENSQNGFTRTTACTVCNCVKWLISNYTEYWLQDSPHTKSPPWLHCPQFQSRNDQRPHRLPRIHRRQLGCPLLPPRRLHPSMYHRIRRLCQTRARVHKTRSQTDWLIRQHGRGSWRLDQGHWRDFGKQTVLPHHRRQAA